MSETNLTWQKYKNSGNGSIRWVFTNLKSLLIVCKDNASNFCKYFHFCRKQ